MRRLSPVERARGVWALRDTVAAADTTVVILNDDSVGPFVSCTDRAASHAGWVVALHTWTRQEIRSRSQVVANFKYLDPLLHGWNEGHSIASLGAVAATVALGQVNDHYPLLIARGHGSRRQYFMKNF